MRAIISLFSVLLMVVIGFVIYYGFPAEEESSEAGQQASTPVDVAPADKPTSLVLALIPERNIFAQRQRYQALAVELSRKLEQSVELVSLNTYQSVLNELASKQIDGAFVGSMLAVLAYDRLGAQILVKPEHLGGASGASGASGGGTYRGVLIVRGDSPITQTSQLAGKSVAMVRTTTAACLFPVYQFYQDGLLADAHTRPRYRWVGTHDQVIQEVMDGTVDCGAVKDLRLDAYLTEHPEARIRRLAVSEAVPDNGLIVRADMSKSKVQELKSVLLNMDQSPEGRKALRLFGASRFLNCRIEDYQVVYQMIKAIGKAWDQLGISGLPLKRSASGSHEPAGSQN